MSTLFTNRLALAAACLAAALPALASSTAQAQPDPDAWPPATWTTHLAGYRAPHPQPLQALEVEDTIYFDEIPVPSGVDVTGVEFAPDFEHWFLEIKVDGASQVAIMNPDGSDYRCLSCGHVASVKKSALLDDEKRIWFANTDGQESGALADYQWSVLECSPSIYQCDDVEVLAVDFPIDSISSLPQGAQNREATPDGDGGYVVWNEVRVREGTRVTVGKLVRNATSYTVTSPRVVQPQFTKSDNVADWVNGGRFYEGGRFVAGNRYIKYQTTRTSSNYDTGLLDLTTGEYRFMTRDLDYNETGDESPSGGWYTYSSARGLDRMDVFSQLVRPPFLDMVSFGQLGRVGLFNNRRCMNEAWLMDFHGQRPGGYAGQPLITEDNWLARKRQWFPDSRQLLLTEQLLPNVAGSTPKGRQMRLRIIRLPGAPAAPALTSANLDDVDWDRITVPASEYRGMASRTVPRKVLHGRDSGRAILKFAGTYASGAWSVRYINYSDDGRSFVNGRESITVPFAVANSVWSADLTIHGELKGSTKGTLTITPQGQTIGKVATTINGKTWRGVPTQDTCPGVLQPQLRARADVKGDKLIVKVTSLVPEDQRARPVTHAEVRVGDQEAYTTASGTASFPLPPAGTSVEASAGGFKAAATVVSGVR